MKKSAGIIAAGHPKTAEAGKIMFSLGGNAFDAAIAAALAACVVESTLTSLGGGGFFLAHTCEQENWCWDFFSQTPLTKKPTSEVDFYPVAVNFGGAKQEFHIGLGSIAIPGSIAGLFTVHQQLGRLPLDLVVEPAINYARHGFELTDFNGFCLRLLEPILLVYPSGREIYAPQGKLLAPGERCFIRDFVHTLEIFAHQGSKPFYQGEIANHIINNIAARSYLSGEDFTNYQVIKRKPLQVNYRGYDILTNPPPSSGGILIAFALKLLEKYGVNSLDFWGTEHLNLLIKIMNLTNQARQNDYDDYYHQGGIEQVFLGEKNLQKWGSTTHISVLDGEGNAASLTTTNGEGSSFMVPQLGMMLNNMLGEEDINPLGFHRWLCNQRLSSMMSPTIILDRGQPRFVLGSGGSNRIRTALLQVISHLLDYRLSLDGAIQAARIHWENQALHLEPFLGREEVLAGLEREEISQVHLWEQENMFFGGVHGVGIDSAGLLVGSGDRRRQGAWEKSE